MLPQYQQIVEKSSKNYTIQVSKILPGSRSFIYITLFNSLPDELVFDFGKCYYVTTIGQQINISPPPLFGKQIILPFLHHQFIFNANFDIKENANDIVLLDIQSSSGRMILANNISPKRLA